MYVYIYIYIYIYIPDRGGLGHVGGAQAELLIMHAGI